VKYVNIATCLSGRIDKTPRKTKVRTIIYSLAIIYIYSFIIIYQEVPCNYP